jgi:hypothetical protein
MEDEREEAVEVLSEADYCAPRSGERVGNFEHVVDEGVNCAASCQLFVSSLGVRQAGEDLENPRDSAGGWILKLGSVDGF